MNAKSASLVALAVAASAVGYFLTTGQMLDAPVNGVCIVAQARGPCEAAKAFEADPANSEYDCEPGEQVYGFAEVVAPPDFDPGEATAALPPGFFALDDSGVEVACDTLIRPTKALTIRRSRPGMDCIVGPWEVPNGAEVALVWDGRLNTAKACGPEVRCQAGKECARVSPLVHAGLDNTADTLRWLVGDEGYADAAEKQRVSDLPWCERFPDDALCAPPEPTEPE